jgi:hypothetical protein
MFPIVIMFPVAAPEKCQGPSPSPTAVFQLIIGMTQVRDKTASGEAAPDISPLANNLAFDNNEPGFLA